MNVPGFIMPLPKGANPNHPQPGSAIMVEPIRSKRAITNIKKLLSDQPRNLALFTVGINTAYRASDLLTITVGQARGLQPGDILRVKQPKTAKYRSVTVNGSVAEAIEAYLIKGKRNDDDEPLFIGRKGALRVPTVTNLVKGWCRDVGLKGNYGSHTLRKTWGFWQRDRGTPVPILMEAFGHASQQQTMQYLGIQAE